MAGGAEAGKRLALSFLIQINLERQWLPKPRAAGKSIRILREGGREIPLHAASRLGGVQWFKWPLKRTRPLRTIRGTASLR